MYRKFRGAFKEYTITLMIEQSVLSVCYRSILHRPGLPQGLIAGCHFLTGL